MYITVHTWTVTGNCAIERTSPGDQACTQGMGVVAGAISPHYLVKLFQNELLHVLYTPKFGSKIRISFWPATPYVKYLKFAPPFQNKSAYRPANLLIWFTSPNFVLRWKFKYTRPTLKTCLFAVYWPRIFIIIRPKTVSISHQFSKML